MTTVREWGITALAAVALIGSAVIAAVGHVVPQELWNIDLVLVSAAAGQAISPTTTSPTVVTAPAGSTLTPPQG